jgi:hypothetical protein
MITSESYSASGIKRTRRTQDELAAIDQVMADFIRQYKPVSVRQVYYNLCSRRIIPKDEKQYDSIQKRLSKLRKAKAIPYEWIADGTRWVRRPTTFDSMTEALEYTILTYRRAIWTHQQIHLEFWMEKEALAGTIADILDGWDVPFYVSRGFSSHSYLYSAAQALMRAQKESHIYVLTEVGAHKPSPLRRRGAGRQIRRRR